MNQIQKRILDRLSSLKQKADELEFVVQQTKDEINSTSDHLGRLADILEESSTDEYGYSGWWPKWYRKNKK